MCWRGAQGVAARQYDAWDLGMTTTDDFCNCDVIYEESLPRIRASLLSRKNQREVPIVTGFLGRGINTGERAVCAGWVVPWTPCWGREHERATDARMGAKA